jgi:hypothetical protein
MSIQILDGYQLNNSNAAIDSRFVVGPGYTYITKNSITYKYPGLRVWDITIGGGTPFTWDGVNWIADALAGSGINATSAQINYLPRFNDTSGNLVNSDIFNGSSNVGIGLTGSNLNLIVNQGNKGLQVAGNIGANGFFYGRGSNITDLNASNMNFGSLSLNRISSNNIFTDNVPFLLQSAPGNLLSWVKSTSINAKNAENAENINIIEQSTSTNTHYLAFSIGTGYKPVNISTNGLRYRPNNGQIQALDGTSAIPTYSFINSNTMGMYFESGLLSFTNNSTRRMSVSTNGVVLYNTNGPQIQFNSSAGDRVLWSKNSDLYFRYDGTIPGSNILASDYKMLHIGNLSIGADSGLTSTGSILTENLIIKHATSGIANTSNTENTFIQNLQFDSFGHVNGFSSKVINDLSIMSNVTLLTSWALDSNRIITNNIDISLYEIIMVTAQLQCVLSYNGFSSGDIVTSPTPYPTDSGRTAGQGIGIQYRSSSPLIRVIINDQVTIMTPYSNNANGGTIFIESFDVSKWNIRLITLYRKI